MKLYAIIDHSIQEMLPKKTQTGDVCKLKVKTYSIDQRT